MTVDLLPPGAPAWDALLLRAEHDFYHLPAYVAASARREGGEPRAIHVEDGERRLLLPVIVRPVADGLRDATSPYGYSGPVVDGGDDAFTREAFLAAEERLARDRIVTLFVRGHPLVGPSLPPEAGTVVDHGPTVSIDLRRPAEDLWKQTRSTYRHDIARALRAGHRAFLDERFEHLSTFVSIYRATMERVAAAPYYLFTEPYFAELRQALGERLHLWVVAIRGEIAAGGLFVETCGLVQYHLSGTDARFVREGPTKLMLHFVRAWARERGDRYLHLGGGVGGAEDSLFAFKAGFSPERHRFQTLRVVADEPAYRALVHARDPARDPADRRGFFPLYRSPSRATGPRPADPEEGRTA
ncbi:MAG TPA: GNAT family N-acetyltransferase [Vicinamibacteria bacterium]|nr:GNAT family N-acetyltransferase [Vicinamibacteria bacterium]